MLEGSAVIHERDRMAQRADKWWRSVWHVQMCMSPRGIGFDVMPETLTTDVSRDSVKARSTKPKPSDGPSGT